MTRMPPLETARLVIRPFVMADLDALHQIVDVELSEADFGAEGAQSLDERRKWLEWAILNYDQLAKMYQPPYGDRAIELKQTGQLIGSIGYVPCMALFGQLPSFAAGLDEMTQRLALCELGLYYALAPAHQRQGYTSEAAAAMVEYAFQGMRLRRVISLDPVQPVVYCEETAINLATFDRPISWNHHVTFGPPFLESSVTLFDMPATRSKVCPATFSKQMSIEPDAEFRWPNAPTKKGGLLNLRTTETGRFGHYTAHLLDPAVETAFIAVCNPRLRLLVLYLFTRHDFPWVGNWEESYSRVHVPWNGREFCRGFEFSTTPFPIPRRATVTNGKLFEESTYKWLPARSTETTRYMVLMLDVPEDCCGVRTVKLKPGSVLVYEKGKQHVLSVRVKRFL